MNVKHISGLMILAFTAIACAADQAIASFFSTSILTAGLSIGIAGCGCGIGMGIAVSGALQSMARQPEMLSKLQVNMILGLVFIETLAIYTLFISLLSLFANPFQKLFVN